MSLSMIPIFIALFMLRLGESQGWLPIWARSYGDDFVVLPLVLSGIRWVQRRVQGKPLWTLPVSHGLLAVVFFMVLFEWFLPEIFARGISDYWDCFMYGLGFLYFHFLVNQPSKTRGSIHCLANFEGQVVSSKRLGKEVKFFVHRGAV